MKEEDIGFDIEDDLEIWAEPKAVKDECERSRPSPDRYALFRQGRRSKEPDIGEFARYCADYGIAAYGGRLFLKRDETYAPLSVKDARVIIKGAAASQTGFTTVVSDDDADKILDVIKDVACIDDESLIDADAMIEELLDAYMMARFRTATNTDKVRDMLNGRSVSTEYNAFCALGPDAQAALSRKAFAVAMHKRTGLGVRAMCTKLMGREMISYIFSDAPTDDERSLEMIPDE